jgi:hypothetical protein
MGVLHPRCAGLDVHKSLPSRKRGIPSWPASRHRRWRCEAGGAVASDDNQGPDGLVRVAVGRTLHPHRDGGHWRVLEACSGTSSRTASSNWCWRMRRPSRMCRAARPTSTTPLGWPSCWRTGWCAGVLFPTSRRRRCATCCAPASSSCASAAAPASFVLAALYARQRDRPSRPAAADRHHFGRIAIGARSHCRRDPGRGAVGDGADRIVG